MIAIGILLFVGCILYHRWITGCWTTRHPYNRNSSSLSITERDSH